MEIEDTPLTLLRGQVPSLAKALLQQMKSPRTPVSTLQGGYSLLHTLLTVSPGCLTTQAPQVISNAKQVLTQPSSASAANLQVSCLSFLGFHPWFALGLSNAYTLMIHDFVSIHPRFPPLICNVFRLSSHEPLPSTLYHIIVGITIFVVIQDADCTSTP